MAKPQLEKPAKTDHTSPTIPTSTSKELELILFVSLTRCERLQ